MGYAYKGFGNFRIADAIPPALIGLCPGVGQLRASIDLAGAICYIVVAEWLSTGGFTKLLGFLKSERFMNRMAIMLLLVVCVSGLGLPAAAIDPSDFTLTKTYNKFRMITGIDIRHGDELIYSIDVL